MIKDVQLVLLTKSKINIHRKTHTQLYSIWLQKFLQFSKTLKKSTGYSHGQDYAKLCVHLFVSLLVLNSLLVFV